MTKEIEKIIARFKKEVGKSKQMTAREMKLIEICIDELVVKNCNLPVVMQRSEPLPDDDHVKLVDNGFDALKNALNKLEGNGA